MIYGDSSSSASKKRLRPSQRPSRPRWWCIFLNPFFSPDKHVRAAELSRPVR